MASLKDLRGRINSVKSTRKITQAMKMVAAAKLRRSQSQAEAARPYAERMEAIRTEREIKKPTEEKLVGFLDGFAKSFAA